MPINVYTGLMRSGKSYEVVSEVIVPAIRTGRRVVTNVDGISQEKIHEYLKLKNPDDDESLYGSVLHVGNTQVFDPEFFPYYDDHKGAHTDTVVQPGDLVCIDEAWRFWGATDCRLHKNHRSFFLEHGHFTNEKTNVACDLVLMIQDMNTLNRFVKNVVAFNFRTHKKVSLGLGGTYSLNMWEGHKQVKGALIGNWIRKYKKDVFPLYSSFKGGAEGVMVNADRRQNIFTNKKLWFMLGLLIVGAVVCFYNVWKFFNPGELGKDGRPVKSGSSSSSPAGGKSSAAPVAVSPVVSSAAPVPVFSEAWRVSGSFLANGQVWVVLVNSVGVSRLVSPSEVRGVGMLQLGDIDGARVAAWTGVTRSASSVSSPAPASAPAVAPASSLSAFEVKK